MNKNNIAFLGAVIVGFVFFFYGFSGFLIFNIGWGLGNLSGKLERNVR